jgi:hypothetical protein
MPYQGEGRIPLRWYGKAPAHAVCRTARDVPIAKLVKLCDRLDKLRGVANRWR